MKLFHIPESLGYRFHIQTPSGKHAKFRILKQFKSPPDGCPKSQNVENGALNSVNAQLKAGVISKEAAKREVLLIVEGLYHQVGVKKFKLVSNQSNRDLFEEFWKDRYGKSKLVDPASAKAKYLRAIDRVGELSLLTATQSELQKALDASVSDKKSGRTYPNKQRESAGRLNSILQWARKDEEIVLEFMNEEEDEVRYLNSQELERMLQAIDLRDAKQTAAFRIMCRVAFGTGARIGELFAFTDMSYQGGSTVFIKHQIRRDGVRALAKSKRSDYPGRKAYVLQDYRKNISKWLEVKNDLEPEHRLSAANIVRAASVKAFGKNRRDKHIKFHDLRHSYAIELCRLEVSLFHISQNLGNTEAVCAKHYTGFQMTSDVADLIQAKESASRKKKPA